MKTHFSMRLKIASTPFWMRKESLFRTLRTRKLYCSTLS